MASAVKTAKATMQSSTFLAHARLLWSLGDWTALSELRATADTESEPGQELVLYIVAALYQLGRDEEATQLLQSQPLDKQNKVLATKLLVSGVFNSLARANACSFNHDATELHFKQALACVLPQPLSKAVINARATEQLAQLGIPRLSDNIMQSSFDPDARHHLVKADQYFSHEPAIQIALAEHYQQHEQFDKAIVHWQNVSAQLNADMPQLYYDRLKDAYKQSKGFPPGTVEQEVLAGDIDKHELLADIHKKLSPNFYLEIGVQTGKSLALARCEAIGIDPMPMLNRELPSNTKVITVSSDTFFSRQSDTLLRKSIDLSFIDGMHLFEYVLRDFINVERHSRRHSLIVIDDIFPGHPDQAKRARCTRAWTGDVWKLKVVIEQYRPELVTLAVNAYPTGLLFIAGLDPENTVLTSAYETIVEKYATDIPLPHSIAQRINAVSGKAQVIDHFLVALRQARELDDDAIAIKSKLTQVIGY